ncbi:MAG TPA: 3,4-dehydroadipyl-CoA semialdehyde dehydrogenase, partial [Saprospiraceae bacterium]|nr:3,4-dehydroadipyl-CoA semialdehyde dehydrogenase [Saprospiraceae bacterium]
MNYLQNYILGHWQNPEGQTIEQYNAITGELIALAGSEGLDYKAIYKYGREVGGPALRRMTFPERGLILKALALHLHKIKNKYYEISYWTGATKTDSWIDIEGGIGNLFVYASLRKQFQDAPFYVEGNAVNLSKDGSFIGHHLMVPKQGVAVHINAFNFPIWGMLEKIAVNLLAGVPAIVKPSEITSYLAEAMVRDIIASGILPEGSLQFIGGKGIGILDPATSQDVVTFTGSAATGLMLKKQKSIIENSVPYNMEADSLNAAILGKDVTPDMPEFGLFIKEIRKEMTVKAGQKCTAIRRIIVPENMVEPVRDALAQALDKTTIGNPTTEGVRMGALASQKQLESVRRQVVLLAEKNEIVYGNLEDVDVMGADARKGAFLSPILLYNKMPLRVKSTHRIEAFGPVSTIMPYKKLEDA